jgi:transcriptional regulator with XRE-family HTH domain
MSLGERLAALRIKQGLSQGELAEKMDVSRQSVSKWETEVFHS